MTKLKSIFLWLISFFYTPVAVTEIQPKENTVKLALALLINNQLADGLAANTVQVTLTDDSDAVQSGAVVNLTADNGAAISPTSALTDANGQITASIVSSVAGSSVVTVTATDGTVVRGQVSFAAVPAPVSSVVDPTPVVDAAAEAKAGVADLDAALSFIESGVAQLGEAAKDELKELAKKYL
ncbi:Ig-like domain-containing protein [Rahnella sp. ChDrAdgB13]|uniref:Ig-like domain-containing protein n=1 Tax=Rahnella sp. ChDrAdgB13 TaxID=1850581 RepID=UPI001AD8917F|nr:Ig-like domain-containing protein [Rahnella sp. ChDrAdgB13]